MDIDNLLAAVTYGRMVVQCLRQGGLNKSDKDFVAIADAVAGLDERIQNGEFGSRLFPLESSNG